MRAVHIKSFPRSLKFSLAAIAVTLVSFSGGSAFPAEPAAIGWRKDYGLAVRDSAKLKRPMFVQVSAPWCGYCKKMNEQTFADKQIIERMNRSFVPLKLDSDTDAKLVKELGVESLPTTVIISADMKIVGRVAGFRTPVELATELAPYEKAELPAGVAVVSQATQ